jgi:Flp pilus assembly protein TadD
LSAGEKKALFIAAANDFQIHAFDDALAKLDLVLAEDPLHADSFYLKGLIHVCAGENRQALEAFLKAIAIEEKPIYYGNLGAVYKALGQLKEAEDSYRRALVLNPDLSKVHMALGLLLWEEKRLSEAEEFLARLAQIAPNEPHGFYFLGRFLEEQGRAEEAEKAFRRALALAPSFAEAHNDFGGFLKSQGRAIEALPHYKSAAALKPQDAAILNNLGGLCRDLGLEEEAEAAFRKALAVAPQAIGATNNLALLLQATGRFAEAEKLYRAGLDIKPDSPEILRNYAALMMSLRRETEAEALYRRLAAAAPRDAEAYNNLGVLLKNRGAFEEAEACCRNALRLRPDYVEALNNLAVLLTRQKRFTEAEEICRRALALRPDDPVIHDNLGVLFCDQKRFEEAEAFYRKALALDPDCADAHHNLALLLLQTGRMEEGWRAYEWRYHPGMAGKDAVRSPLYGIPMWKGESLAGKKILIQAEQAFGDEIQYARYAAFLKAQGAEVWMMTRAPLAALMRGLNGIDRVLTKDELLAAEACNFWIFALSLPFYAGTRMETIPASVPYFKTDPEKGAFWRGWLEENRLAEKIPEGARKIGLVWAGKPYPPGRSLHIKQLAGLAACPNAVFVSLQMEEARAQLQEAPHGLKIVDAASLLKDFSDTAALLQNLDLLISIDSAPAHLAGALGVPVWTLLQWQPDWRWFLEGEKSPWYPSMRLFRQKRVGTWDEALHELEKAFLSWAQGNG